jgi:phage terminase small subunit
VTERQKRFVNAYLVEPNATKAAEAAGYSKKTAYAQGSRLLKNAEVSGALETASKAAAAQSGVTIAWVLEEQAALYRTTKGTNEEVARKCLRDIGEHLGMYVERVESTNTNVSYVIEAPAKFDNTEWQQRYSQIQ